MQVALVIPTVLPERSGYLSELLYALSRQVDWPLTVFPDPSRSARLNYDRAWGWAASIGAEWLLTLDDDVLIAPTFGAVIPEILSQSPLSIAAVTFYSNSEKDLRALQEGKHILNQPPSSFYGELCLAIRTYIVKDFLRYAPGWYKSHPEHIDAHDLAFREFLVKHRLRMWRYVPSQVQHRKGPTTIPGHNRGRRESRSFRKVFGNG